jgi:hypothetical protein
MAAAEIARRWRLRGDDLAGKIIRQKERRADCRSSSLNSQKYPFSAVLGFVMVNSSAVKISTDER